MAEDCSGDPIAQTAALIDDLQRESRERQAELRSIADDLPAATSRRVLIVQMLTSVREAPNRLEVVTRTLAKIARLPADFVRRLR